MLLTYQPSLRPQTIANGADPTLLGENLHMSDMVVHLFVVYIYITNLYSYENILHINSL